MSRQNRHKAATQQRSPFVVVLIVAAVVALGVVGYSLSSNLGGNNMAIAPIEVPGLNNMDSLRALAIPMNRGDSNAQITIIEFGDYQCPSCRYFEESIKPRIDLAYINDGKAKFQFFDFPLAMHPYSFIAARAARCAGDQGKYFEYGTALFANQPTWATRPAPPAREFVGYAESLGLDAKTFEQCLRSDKHADVVTANAHVASQLNLGGTPAVLIQVGDGLPRVVDYTDLQSIFPAIAAKMDSLTAGAAPAATNSSNPGDGR